jgi:hypothetical protein
VKCPGHQFVTGHPTPGRQILVYGGLSGTYLEKLPSKEWVYIFPDQQQEAVPAIETSSVKAGIRIEGMALDRDHMVLSLCGSICDARRTVAQELDELRAADDDGSINQVLVVELPFGKTGRADKDFTASLREIVHEFFYRSETFFTNVIGVSAL